jgi:ABC-type multidrug transport system ATPase subunit
MTICTDAVCARRLATSTCHRPCRSQRTNIGIALISDPRVLFLDEPTSGLDSFSANEVVELSRGLSRGGVTVVATIHSPSAAAFAMFDRVLMLARGHTVFFGPNLGMVLVCC